MAKLLNVAIVCALLVVVTQFAKKEQSQYAIEVIDTGKSINYARINYEVDLESPKSKAVSEAKLKELADTGPVFLNDKEMCAPKWFGLYQTYKLTYFLIKDGVVHTTRVDLRDKFRQGQRGHKCAVWDDKIYVFVPR